MTPAVESLVDVSARLLDQVIDGPVRLALAGRTISELAVAVSRTRADCLDDVRLSALWRAAWNVVEADQSFGCGWVDLLPLLTRLREPLAAVKDAEDLRRGEP